MNDCINKTIGCKLHAFELGTLSDVEREEFESHLYECDHCFSLVQQFRSPAQLLRYDSDVKRLVSEQAMAATPRRSRYRVLSLTVAVAAMVVIAIVLTQRGGQSPEPPQVLRLLPMRGMPSNVIQLEKGGDVEFRFVFDGADETTVCQLTIDGPDGTRVYSEARFDGFNSKGLGIIRLPLEIFNAGVHTLTLTDLSNTSPLPTAVYRFLVQ